MKKLILIFLAMSIFSGTSVAQNTYPILSNTLSPHIINIPGGKIEYYRFGQGTPLILIAGYFANVKSWNMPFLKMLSAKHDVIILDNRNVGASVNSSKSYTTLDLAEDIDYLVKALNLSHVNIFGISMGGMIAQQFAITYPKTVDHLILMNTFIAGIKPTVPNKEVQEDLYSQPKSKLKQYLMALRILFPKEARFKMFFSFMRDRFNPYTKETPISPTVIKQQQALVLGWIKNTAALEKIKQLKMPVLILSGGADYVIPSPNTDVLHKEIQHSTLVRWKNGGHAMIFQYPEAIANVINQWLD